MYNVPYFMCLYYKFLPNVQLVIYCHIRNSLPYSSFTVCSKANKYCSEYYICILGLVSRAGQFVWGRYFFAAPTQTVWHARLSWVLLLNPQSVLLTIVLRPIIDLVIGAKAG